ncbi:MAG TPA: DUF190 domain-containing protein [Bacteroidota bacterium]
MVEVQIFLDEEDRHHGEPTHEHILRYLMHHKILGATMFKGTMGFGSHHHLQTPTKFGATDASPILIVFVDDDDRVTAVLPHLKEILSEGLIVSHRVERL